MLKSQIHIVARGWCWRSSFDAESKNAKITNSSFLQVWEGGGLAANF